MVQAYILVQTEVGKAADVAVHIGQIGGVTQADDVTGPYDVIVRAEADNVDDLGKLVEIIDVVRLRPDDHVVGNGDLVRLGYAPEDRNSTRLNSSHPILSY